MIEADQEIPDKRVNTQGTTIGLKYDSFLIAILIMRERAEAVGGTLNVSSTLGKGTRIEASLPFQHNGKVKTGYEELE